MSVTQRGGGFRLSLIYATQRSFSGEERVAREERRGVAVGPDAEQDDVEDRAARGVLNRELADELRLARFREVLEVIRELGVDRVDRQRRAIRGELPEEFARAERVVRVFVVERHDALVGVGRACVHAGKARRRWEGVRTGRCWRQ